MVRTRFDVRVVRVACFAAAVLLVPRFAEAEIGLVPIGGEIAVSVPDGDYESHIGLASDRNGSWGAVWNHDLLDFEEAGSQYRYFNRDGEVIPETWHGVALRAADLALDGQGRGAVVGIRERPELSGAEVDAICLEADGSARGDRVRVDAGDISAATRLPHSPRVAMDSTGSMFVVWEESPRPPGVPPSIFFRRLDANCQPLGNVQSLGAVGVVGRREPEVAILAGGGAVLVWVEGEEVANYRVMMQRFDADGDAAAAAIAIDAPDLVPRSPAVAVGAQDEIAVAWHTADPDQTEGEGVGIAARVIGSDGTPHGAQFALRTPREAFISRPSIDAVGGAFVAAWGESGCFFTCNGVFARLFDALGPASAETVVQVDYADPGVVRIVSTGGSEMVIAWEDWSESTLPPDIVARRFALFSPGTSCVAGTNTLCLGDGRFRVEVEYRDFLGNRGVGKAHPLTPDSGLFWFFESDNLEMLVKTVDACAGYSKFWVFAAATTNVEYTLTVTDTGSGRSRSYFNPLGRSSPAVTDTAAFGCP
jgi:hypothetical protein